MTDPTPGDLDRHSPNESIARSACSTFSLKISTLMGRWSQPCQRAVGTDPLEPHQLFDLSLGTDRFLPKQCGAFPVEIANLIVRELPPLVFPFDPLTNSVGYDRSVPKPRLVEPRRETPVDRTQAKSVVRQPCPFLRQRSILPVQ